MFGIFKRKTPSPPSHDVSNGRSFMAIATTSAMLVIEVGGGMQEAQFNALLELVSTWNKQDKTTARNAMAHQYAMIMEEAACLDYGQLPKFIQSGRPLALEMRREILILCFAMTVLGGGAKLRQSQLIDIIFQWLDVSLDDRDFLRELAENRFC